MSIMIGENYKLGSNRLNLILYSKFESGEEKDNQDFGEDVEKGWRIEGFFGTLRNAIDFMVRIEINRTKFESIEIVNNKVEELQALINKVCPDITVSSLRERDKILDKNERL